MPTLRYQNDGFATTGELSSTITMPQSIKASIALSPHLNAACSSTEGKTTFSGQQPCTSIKHPPQGGQPRTHDSTVSGASNILQEAQLNGKCDSALVANTIALLPATQAPFKRTKKIAKPRTLKGAKVSTYRAKKLPTKKSAGRAQPNSPAAGGTEHDSKQSSFIVEKGAKKASSPRARTLPTKKTQGRVPTNAHGSGAKGDTDSFCGAEYNQMHSKQSPIIDEGGGGTTTPLVNHHGPAKTGSKITVLVSQDGDDDELIAQKRKKAKNVKLDNTGISNVSKAKPIHVQGRGKKTSSSASPRSGGGAKRAKLFSNEIDSEDLQIKKSVNDVIDTVADEIRHCAFMFDLTHKLKVIISSAKGEGSNKELPAASNTADCSIKTSAGSDPDLCDIHTVIQAVRRFAVEVYCPFLLSARQCMGNKSPNFDRIRVSTLLAVREMLILNADNLFTFSTLDQTPKSSRERLYLLHVFANAIVRNAAKRLHSNAEHGQLFADFVHASHNYDRKSEDFQFALARTDVRSVYVRQGDKPVGPEETTLAKIGFNFARERHPLLHYDRLTLKEDASEALENGRPLTCPLPTACAAFYIETTTEAPDERDDHDKRILKSFTRLLGDKQQRNNRREGVIQGSK